MADKQPNIVVFFWDNFGWGEIGCYGGGVLRGAPTPRIDSIADEGLKLLNFNVEAQCTPSRSAILTGRHPIRSGTHSVPLAGGPDGLTQWEVTIARALSDAGYATGMWGKWHLGSDPEQRSPVDFGFDEAVWSPRTADEVLWTMQSYFPNGNVTAAPYAGKTEIPLEPEPIYARKKGGKHEVVATYDAEFRAGFDRKITGWAIDFMRSSHEQGKPFYLYLPYTQTHIPTIPDPEYVGRTKHGNWADILTQMDDFTGQVLDELDTLGLADDTIVVWASDNGGDSTYRMPAGDPDPFGGLWNGFGGPWRGSLFTSLEGSNRTPCIIRWPGKVPAAKVSNELVHEVDLFTTLVLAGGGTVPTDRQIDGMDMRTFLLGDAEESGREVVLCMNGNRLQAVKWRQWKVHLFQQDDFYSTWAPYSIPRLYNLEWDPREENEVDFPHAWVMHPMAAAAGAFLKSLAMEPPIKPGTPDPYTPPAPGQLVPQEHVQIGPIVQYVTTLHHPDGQAADVREHQPEHGLSHASGA
ncbi:sulfatase-like hydrolase/transferase [Nocardioides ungokensis]